VIRIALAVLLFAPLSAAAQTAADGGVLTLDRAVALAAAANRPVKIAEKDVDKASVELASVHTRRYPAFNLNLLQLRTFGSVDFFFPAGSLGNMPGVGPFPVADTTVHSENRFSTLMLFRVTQPLTQLKEIGLREKQLAISRDLAKERLRAQQQAASADVRQLYYGMLQTESAINASRDTLKLYQEVERVVGELVEREAALKGEVLNVKVRVAQEEQKLTVLGNTRTSLGEQLNLVMGRDVRTPIAVAPIPDLAEAEANLDDAQRRGLLNRPEIRQARLTLTQAEYDIQVAKAARIPEVAGTFTSLGFYNVDVLPTQVVGAGFVVNWELWDWGRKKRDAAVKTTARDQAALAVTEAENRVLVDISARFRKVQEARGVLRIAQLAQDAARENLRVLTERLQQQAALPKDVLQGQATLSETQEQYRQALLAFYNAKADFERAVGE
jgi:outer membrane protein TolC